MRWPCTTTPCIYYFFCIFVTSFIDTFLLYKESAFSLYSKSVNFDNSQSEIWNIGKMIARMGMLSILYDTSSVGQFTKPTIISQGVEAIQTEGVEDGWLHFL